MRKYPVPRREPPPNAEAPRKARHDYGLSPSRVALCVQGLVPALRMAELSLTGLGILCRCRVRPRTIGDLARWLLVSPAAVSLCVDELVRRQLVVRVPQRGDRRRVQVRVTPPFEELWKKIGEDLREAVRFAAGEEAKP